MVNVAVIDYDMGNLHSACKGLEKAGAIPRITDSHQDILEADAVVLPGVGAFDPAMRHIRERNLEATIKRQQPKNLFWVFVWAYKFYLTVQPKAQRWAWGLFQELYGVLKANLI